VHALTVWSWAGRSYACQGQGAVHICMHNTSPPPYYTSRVGLKNSILLCSIYFIDGPKTHVDSIRSMTPSMHIQHCTIVRKLTYMSTCMWVSHITQSLTIQDLFSSGSFVYNIKKHFDGINSHLAPSVTIHI
jgi:hypothetical protein